MALFLSISRLVLAIIYILIGVTGFVTFIWLKNYPAAVLGIVTAFISGIQFHLHYLNIKGTLSQWYLDSELRVIGRIGIVAVYIGTVCFTYYIVIQVMFKKDILPVSTSAVIPIVFSFITLKCGAFLLYYSCMYRRASDENILIVHSDEDPLGDSGIIDP